MIWNGKNVSEGLAMAKLYLFSSKLPEILPQTTTDPEREIQRIENALSSAQRELNKLYENAKRKMGKKEAEIFDTHLTMLGDEYSVREPILQRIREQKQTAETAINAQFDELEEIFCSLNDEQMTQRAADIEDLKQLLLSVCLETNRKDISSLTEDVIILTEELTPSDTVRMDITHVRGIVTKLGGETAHSAIIARTLGIPCIVGIDGWQNMMLNGHLAIMDGDTLITDPDEDEQSSFRTSRQAKSEEQQELVKFINCVSRTKDGISFELCANIGTPQEAVQANEYGADGVGLFRSEFLFMDRETLPTEEEQFEAYRKAVQTMGSKPLIIRTLDIGGDKKLPSLELPHEDNPFLGFRAIRITLRHPEIFIPQLRALLRTAIFGNVQIMFPMICCLQELHEAKELLHEQAQLLQMEGCEIGPVKVGMMIEIPAAAIMAEEFAREVDFFSIGTNDLVQYTLAVERGNESVAQLYTPMHPAILRLIAMTAQAAAAHNIPCGMCGEAAGDLALAPAFLGMGINELSMNPRRIPLVRRLLSGLSLEECKSMAEELLGR